MNKLLWLALALLGIPFVAVQAASNDRIVAVVNDDIITLSELKARTTLASRVLGVDLKDPRAGNALLRRTLSELVDETLQRQYAEERSMQLTRAELQSAKDQAVSQVGANQWSELTKGVGKAADDKLRAEATWARLMAAAVAPRVQLGTAELDKLIAEMSKTQNQTEKNLSMIFIPATEDAAPAATEVSGTATPDAAARVQAIRAEVLAANDGATAFAAAAKTNSAAPSAKDGGELG
ncbi:MAG: SurA N-terminal domain-containing protein, partial [Alphaproteobacteria bacterium]|nr:SurA N-terminal domain-containing protein [Alphaproteobacteria bacterium]